MMFGGALTSQFTFSCPCPCSASCLRHPPPCRTLVTSENRKESIRPQLAENKLAMSECTAATMENILGWSGCTSDLWESTKAMLD